MSIVALGFPQFFSFVFTGQSRTLVFGDSIVKYAGERNSQLHGGGEVAWKGLSGARLVGVGSRLRRYLNRNPFPTTIIVHLGSNDVFALGQNLGVTRSRMAETLMTIRNILPDTRIIWSDILLRQIYKREQRPGAGKRCTRNLNKYARKLCKDMEGAHVVKHSHLIQSQDPQPDIYYRDGIHLGDFGNLMFRQNLSNALVFFNAHPEAFHFPPRDYAQQ